MIRRLLVAALLLVPSLASAQNWASTKAQQEFKKALTAATFFGVPRYTTVALPTCNTANTGAVAWNTTTGTLYGCDGSAWAATGGGGGTSFTGVTDITFANAGVIRTGTTAADTVLFQAYDNDTGPAYVTMATLTAGNTPSFTLQDDVSWIVGATDPTKRARFEVDGFTAANDRVFTLPGTTGNDTFMMLGGTQAISGNKTFQATVSLSSNIGLDWGATLGAAYTRTALTPDSLAILTGSLSNSLHINEYGDTAFDFQNCSAGTSAATNPTLCIHSADGASTTKWLDAKHDGTNGVIDVGTGVVSMPDGITTAGTVVSTRTSDLGWSVVAGANTACTTTCTHAAVLGFDTAVTAVPVGPSDATADICLCAGAN